MIWKIKLAYDIICLIPITLLFLDFTRTLHGWSGWLVKIQFLLTVLALNIGVVAFLIILTAASGRIYYSVICPFGVLRDVAAWVEEGQKKLPYSCSPVLFPLHYGVLAIFITTLIAGISFIITSFAPYSAYGHIANNLSQPIQSWGNNLLVRLVKRFDSYAFYDVEVWTKNLSTFIIAAATFVTLTLLTRRNGHTHYSTTYPMGTVLGLLPRYPSFCVTTDMDKCNGCGLCTHHYKVVRTSPKEHTIDYNRCVTRTNCLGKCKQKAFSY